MKSHKNYRLLYVLIFIFFYGNAQKPLIKVENTQLGISSLKINVTVFGNIATTTYDMQFYNPLDKVLEGELNFPLGENQNVVRLALEINGKLREAVVVEKEIGRIAFEAVVRRGADPILLEKITGNNYKARIYPIPAKGYKRIILAFDQTLTYKNNALKLYLPLAFNKKMDLFKLNISVFNTSEKPLTIANSLQLNFTENTTKFETSLIKQNYMLDKNLEVLIPVKKEIPIINRTKNFFYLSQQIAPQDKLRILPKSMDLIWDASSSMKNKNSEKEFKILEAYFKKLKNITVNLIAFSNEIITNKTFNISNANWSELKKYLESVNYDGATNYDKLYSTIQNTKSDVTLFFSDFMPNLIDNSLSLKNTTFIINSVFKSNHTLAKKTLLNNDGAYINLNALDINDALHTLTYKKYELLEISSNNPKTEMYPKTISNLNLGINISGKNIIPNQKIILKFGFNHHTFKTITYTIPENYCKNQKIKKIFIQKKITFLEQEKEKNKEKIIKLSKENNIISDYTSLVVLEDVRDYIKYDITPPKDLQKAYNKLKENYKNTKIITKNEDTNTNIQSENIQGELTISGIVSDELGPVADISVTVKGTNKETVTDFDGKFSIKARMNDDLVFSHISYGSVETTVTHQNINIRMRESGESLEEVVVTAQGIKKSKKSICYSVKTIEQNEIPPSTSLVNVLQGKVSGLMAYGNDSNSIRIRGNNKPPIFILDGMPVSNIDDIIDVNNIDNVTVIKGLSASIKYGSEASNGAIIITTKRANRNYNNYDNSEEGNEIKKTNRYTGSLKIDIPKNNSIYLQAYAELKSKTEYYKLYLTQKENYVKYPWFFIDIYDLFYKKGFVKYADRILSNLIELNMDNYEALKIYAYKLEKIKKYQLAILINKQILKLRPEDVQSYRDLALAYQNNKKYTKAAELLDSIISKKIYKNSYRRNFLGIQKIAKNEITNIASNGLLLQPKYKKYNKIKLYDIRVLIDWNHNDTDIDLHIIDPNLEECYYSHNQTKIGGQLSQDMTQGFGPEEFTIKKAKKGDYYIKIKYFGDRYQKIENPTFIKVTIFKNYGTKNETKELKIIRLNGNKQEYILAKINI